MQKYWPLLLVLGVGLVALVLVNFMGPRERPTELGKEEVEVGTGPEAKAGDKVRVHYTGRLLKTGTKFDSSHDRGEPFVFTLGRGEVIPGWDKGVAGMKVGGKRKLTIPAKLGYGPRGSGAAIPPDADLEFDVELLAVVPRTPPLRQLEKEDVKVGEGRELKRGDKARVHYTGRLLEGGQVFDSSRKRGEPFEFIVGQGVIQGWSEGVVGMKVGGQRKLKIPADLGYGATGKGPIPPNADLEFDIELLGIIQ